MAHAINRNAKNTEARERVVLVQQSLFKGNIEIIEPHRVVVAMGKLPVVSIFLKINNFKMKNFKKQRKGK